MSIYVYLTKYKIKLALHDKNIEYYNAANYHSHLRNGSSEALIYVP